MVRAIAPAATPASNQTRDPITKRILLRLVNGIPLFFETAFRRHRYAFLVLLSALLWLATPMITARPGIWQQAIFGLSLVFLGNWLVRLEEQQEDTALSERLHLVLVALSGLTTLRYFYYRTFYTLSLDSWLNAAFSVLLYAAEMYAILTLFLAYFQTLRIRQRQPIDLSTVPQAQWPTVDVYIPTYNEDVEIVRKTAIAALAIDYPADKKCVYVLDDGRKYPERRAELQAMCDEVGAIMLVRDNNDHAKAGNINTALEKTHGDLVLILDCDHIPARCFLKETVGFFLKPKVALVQTPHWFYNPDPFERNLLTRGQIPVGNELFYKVLQKGNDHWNAAFFCGSAAVVRREYILEIGGIATETVTEDCHTALRLHSLGYQSVYYDKIMVAGLAPEKFSSYVGQQVRWARGMAQILRLENPLFNRKLKLTLAQRLCYFSATSHFFFGFPRLMYVAAPMIYLLLGISSVRGLGLETMAYALPHILLSMQTNHIPYKHVRFSFWNEVYEFAMSFQAGIVTLLALINPKLGSFNVTDKGLTVTERNFDFESVRYLVYLSAIAAASLLAIPFWLVISPQDAQAVLINAVWNVFNLFLLLAACLVAFEQPQLRDAHRLPRKITAIIHSDGQQWSGTTQNVSESGALLLLDEWPNVPDEVRVELIGDYGARVLLDARIIRAKATSNLQVQVAVQFINLSRTQTDDLVLVLYSDVKEWYSQKREQRDNPVDSFKFIAASIGRVFREFRPESSVAVRKQVQAAAYLFWEGWGDVSYPATLTEIGMRDLRLEIDMIELETVEELQVSQPLLSLLVFRQPDDPEPQSLVAQIIRVEVLAGLSDRTILELSFPPELDRQQKDKIRRLLRSLN
ncbi:UDP-forming cellulose synthase catalytic subunit [Thermoleptolyngbya sp. C42_A2020_037]|uniref:UDP-forming cellulose synthase catalytic subunit n=1 Tax=Thermoleptolyngbya sp. C42_A2020_037 TaxID=2747799 RepID=UPI0019FB99B9|nr:UDP-forming cellulose synthase catalytic subunit [Thermoleptolyngbya sp. C42_A2020_037]MBF2085026.1 UDP-forming cellulose synthase catalytic subunit [Thermoleptolyngbya sp. C42_A2020_037]